MGQRHVFADFPGVPDSEETRAILIEKLRQTVGYIEVFRKGFADMFAGMQREREIPTQIPKEFHSEWRRMQQTEIHLQSVSDAIIAWTPIQTKDESSSAKAMNGLWGILMATAGMTLTSLAAKHPLRGGIDVDGGIPIEPGGNEIYGRALNSAYELESQPGGAESPRVLIGKGVITFLDSVEADPTQSRYVGYARMLASRCRQLITADEDDRPILHFLGAGARDVLKLPDYTEAGFGAAFSFVRESAEKFRMDGKLGPRYARLLRYFEKNVGDWE
jgi:hypothetical protein